MAGNSLLFGPQDDTDPYSGLHNLQALFGYGPYAQKGPTTTSVPTIKINASTVPSSPYDVSYDPNYPVSSAYTGGWGSPKALGNALLADKVDGSNPLQYDMLSDQFGLNNANPLKPQLKDAGIPNTPYMAYVTGKDESRLPSETPAQKAIDIVVRGGAPDALRLGQALTGGAWNGMHPVDSMGMPVNSDIPTNSPRYVPRTTGLASIGQPRVTAPAYHQALTAAAQKYGVPAATIHQQLTQQPVAAPTDPLQQKVLQAQQQGQTYDRSRDPSFNPNGGAHGGSLAGF